MHPGDKPVFHRQLALVFQKLKVRLQILLRVDPTVQFRVHELVNIRQILVKSVVNFAIYSLLVGVGRRQDIDRRIPATHPRHLRQGGFRIVALCKTPDKTQVEIRTIEPFETRSE